MAKCRRLGAVCIGYFDPTYQATYGMFCSPLSYHSPLVVSGTKCDPSGQPREATLVYLGWVYSFHIFTLLNIHLILCNPKLFLAGKVFSVTQVSRRQGLGTGKSCKGLFSVAVLCRRPEKVRLRFKKDLELGTGYVCDNRCSHTCSQVAGERAKTKPVKVAAQVQEHLPGCQT